MNNELLKPSCDHSLSLSFPPCFRGKKSKPSLIRVGSGGHKASLKGRRRGSIWGQKALKRPLLLSLWSNVTPRFAPRGNWAESSARSQTEDSIYCCTVSHSLLLFPLSIPSPLPPPHPKLSPSSVTLPLITFKGEERHLIIGYMPISMTAARLVRSSSPAYFCYLAVVRALWREQVSERMDTKRYPCSLLEAWGATEGPMFFLICHSQSVISDCPPNCNHSESSTPLMTHGCKWSLVIIVPVSLCCCPHQPRLNHGFAKNPQTFLLGSLGSGLKGEQSGHVEVKGTRKRKGCFALVHMCFRFRRRHNSISIDTV